MVRTSSQLSVSDDERGAIQAEYEFPLSRFQTDAIYGIKTGKHVLITAHTGSGKTLPAEYAIRHFTDKGKRVIYTAPVKALSNQKFHEFQEKYKGITFGLLTGDIKFNPDAQVRIQDVVFDTSGLKRAYNSYITSC